MKKNIFLISVISFFLFLIDRASKYIALNKFHDDGIYLFGKLIFIKLEKNIGIAFSIPLPEILSIILIILITLLLFFIFTNSIKTQNKLQSTLLLFIIIGALSNLLDRFLYGFVIDFISIYKFPVFNIADAMISCSTILYILLELKNKKTL